MHFRDFVSQVTAASNFLKILAYFISRHQPYHLSVNRLDCFWVQILARSEGLMVPTTASFPFIAAIMEERQHFQRPVSRSPFQAITLVVIPLNGFLLIGSRGKNPKPVGAWFS
jgi:hypothetical protein